MMALIGIMPETILKDTKNQDQPKNQILKLEISQWRSLKPKRPPLPAEAISDPRAWNFRISFLLICRSLPACADGPPKRPPSKYLGLSASFLYKMTPIATIAIIARNPSQTGHWKNEVCTEKSLSMCKPVGTNISLIYSRNTWKKVYIL